MAGIVAGAGLSVAGCVMQNNMRNPLASPFTLGISHAAAFGASMAIIVFGAGSIQGSTGTDTVIINSPSLVTVMSFAWAMVATIIIMLLAGFRGGSLLKRSSWRALLWALFSRLAPRSSSTFPLMCGWQPLFSGPSAIWAGPPGGKC